MKVDTAGIIQKFNTWVDKGGLRATNKTDLETIKMIVQETLQLVDDDSHLSNAENNIIKSVKLAKIKTDIEILQKGLKDLLTPKHTYFGRDVNSCKGGHGCAGSGP